MQHILEKRLRDKIIRKQAIIGIIGLGYVGGALARLIAYKGYQVYGFEKNLQKIASINREGDTRLFATDDTSFLKKCNIIIVCIQTPIRENKTPDLSYLEAATHEIAAQLQKGQLVTIESSINSGVTRNIVLPILMSSGLSEEDFFLSFSPERIDPGNKNFPLEKIPKIVSGLNKNSLCLIKEFYKTIFHEIVPVSTLETAEMVKIFENTFRFINISLTNELKEYTQSIGVDMWEVVKAASTKPFGFLPHFPGPGAGGHCIPVDPFYLYFDAQKKGIELHFIKHAGQVNDKQAFTIVEHTISILNEEGERAYQHIPDASLEEYYYPQPLKQQKVGIKAGISLHQKKDPSTQYHILLVGVAYKSNIDDTRESPAKKIWEVFETLGHSVDFYDPHVAHFQEKESISLDSGLMKYDAFVVITDHDAIDFAYLASFGKPIIDTKHVYTKQLSNIYYI